MTTINPLHPDTSDLKFTFDPFLKSEYRFGLDPSMSISSYITSSMPLTRTFLDRPICRYYDKGYCPRGKACPDKHIYPTYSNKQVIVFINGFFHYSLLTVLLLESCVSIGSEACVRRARRVSSCTSTIYEKCPSVSSFPRMVSVRNHPTVYTSI